MTFASTVPSISYAWNIICGISVGRLSGDISVYAEIGPIKWDADSRALRGISLYYLAVSELQRLDFQNETLSIPMSLADSEVSTIEQAGILLSQSAGEIDASLELAREYNLGDEQGLGLLERIRENVASFYQSLSEGNLPSLGTMQATAELIGEFVQHGIVLSQRHLEGGSTGSSSRWCPHCQFSTPVGKKTDRNLNFRISPLMSPV